GVELGHERHDEGRHGLGEAGRRAHAPGRGWDAPLPAEVPPRRLLRVGLPDTPSLIGTSNKNADRLAVTLASVLAGLPPLSVHLKIDAEGGEWAQLEALLQSPEDLGRIRTLDMEIHFYMDEWSAAAQCQHAEELSRKVGVVEELARVFAVAGTTLQATLEKQAYRGVVAADANNARCGR
ncbi:unnamed protein product, partial [Prorocentrum cordatum]